MIGKYLGHHKATIIMKAILVCPLCKCVILDDDADWDQDFVFVECHGCHGKIAIELDEYHGHKIYEGYPEFLL